MCLLTSARQYRVRGTNGEMRDLIVGDKIPTCTATRALSRSLLTVTRICLLDETEELHGSTDMMTLFRENPGLMSSWHRSVLCPVSTVVLLVRRWWETAPLRLPNGTTIEAGMGKVSFIGTI